MLRAPQNHFCGARPVPEAIWQPYQPPLCRPAFFFLPLERPLPARPLLCLPRPLALAPALPFPAPRLGLACLLGFFDLAFAFDLALAFACAILFDLPVDLPVPFSALRLAACARRSPAFFFLRASRRISWRCLAVVFLVMARLSR